jgi:hypothetical protein
MATSFGAADFMRADSLQGDLIYVIRPDVWRIMHGFFSGLSPVPEKSLVCVSKDDFRTRLISDLGKAFFDSKGCFL